MSARLSTRQIHLGVPAQQGSINGLAIDRATYTNVSRAVSNPAGNRIAVEREWFSPERAAEMFVDPATCKTYSEAHVAEMVEQALYNFDLNMMYFARLGKQEFDLQVESLLIEFPELDEVFDLNTVMEEPGVYVMVLDEYKQMYIGQSVTVGKRIRQHWSSSKRLDRLVYGRNEESLLPVDAFRALDTTRVLALTKGLKSDTKRDDFEAKVAAHADPRFTLNRMPGGNPLDAVAQEVTGGRKVRDLSATKSEWAAYWESVDATEMGRGIHARGRVVAKKKVEPSTLARELVEKAAAGKSATSLIVDVNGNVLRVRDALVERQAEPTPGVVTFEIPCGKRISLRAMQDALDYLREHGGTHERGEVPFSLF